ncbi:MAG: DUF1232 domain-containing protein [Dehalococcoidia bacterium]|nr:MAG: DUF1232 domain-containing protein [Dehalococcoidia bacterium]
MRAEALLISRWKQRARTVRRDTYALYLACRDPRVPWYAKALAGAILTYALSPIDLIPDFIPVLGYLDDLIIIPGGLVLVRRMIPAAVLAEHRETAAQAFDSRAPASVIGAVVVVAIWLLLLALVAYVVIK